MILATCKNCGQTISKSRDDIKEKWRHVHQVPSRRGHFSDRPCWPHSTMTAEPMEEQP